MQSQKHSISWTIWSSWDQPMRNILSAVVRFVFVGNNLHLFNFQLPPAPHHHIKRRLVERFKKSLFQFGSDPYNLKVELSKVWTVNSQFRTALEVKMQGTWKIWSDRIYIQWLYFVIFLHNVGLLSCLSSHNHDHFDISVIRMWISTIH